MKKVPEMEHVDLDREFAPLSSNEDLESDWQRAIANVTGRIQKWKDIKATATVILGEGGTGKTHEFRIQQAALRAQGRQAFFIPLADLIRTDLSRTLGNDWKLFQHWIGTGEEGVLFLDELDEAKLAGSRLDSLLRDLESWLVAATKHCRLVISCRPTEWESKNDLLTLQSFITRWRHGSEAPAGTVEVLSIIPLDVSRACLLAERLGVTNIKAFENALEEHSVTSFLIRPQDVEWVVGYWLSNHRFGSLRELIEANVAQKLVDRRRSAAAVQLAPDRARAGARSLTAVATLSGQRSFPVHESAVDVASAFNVRNVLSTWRADEVNDLLRLPLFDESTSGRVRIHSRAVQEYLFAEWLRLQVRSKRLTIKQLCNIIFKWKDKTTRVLPFHLARIAAWLAPDIDEVFELLVTTAPEQLLDEGDPSALDLNERRRVLREFVVMFGDRNRIERNFSHSGLRRFANSDLAPDIIGLLHERPGEDVAALLLDIVTEGRLGACADIALEIALEGSTSHHVRFAAVAAAAIAGTHKHRESLLSLTRAPHKLELSVAGRLIELLFPDPLNLSLLDPLLRAIAPQGRWNHGTYLDHALLELPKRTPKESRLTVLRTLHSSSQAAQDEWLVRPLVHFLAEILREEPAAIERTEVTEVLAYLGDDEDQYHFHVSMEPLEDLARDSALARRNLLLVQVRHRQKEADRPLRGYDVWDVPFVGRLVNAEDLQWLELEAKRLGDEALRSVASKMHASVVSRATVAIEVPSRRVKPVFEPDAVDQLREHIDDLRNGHAGWLDRCVRAFPVADDWGDSFDAKRMSDELGSDISEAIHVGLAQLWRRYDVPVPRSRSDSSMPGEIRLGLVSIRLEIGRGLDIASFSPDEATRAARLALWELNHFPMWLEMLAATHLPIVEQEVAAEVLAELKTGLLRERVLSKILRGPSSIRVSVARQVQGLLLAQEIPASPAAGYAFELLFETGCIDRDKWKPLLPSRLAASADKAELFALWWSLLLYVDPDAALTMLEKAS